MLQQPLPDVRALHPRLHARASEHDGVADARTVTITLLDESRQDTVCTWTLRRAQPKKLTGPTMAAKGGGDVAMEEIVLVHEGIEYS